MIKREKTTFVVGKKEIPTGQLVEQLGFKSEELQTPIKGPLGWPAQTLSAAAANVHRTQRFDSWMSPPMTWTPTCSPLLKTFWTSGPALSSLSLTTATYWSESPTTNMDSWETAKVRHLPGGVDQYLQLKRPKKDCRDKKGSISGTYWGRA
jgi:hypothetical protein